MDHGQQNESTESSCLTKQKDDKLPHDASVFVGSLPSNIDQGDLTRMLMDHLSEHTQIKNIKVVRDSKGGVCAFVQCDDASSATVLIDTLHSSPSKPFMGRILRYEPARAFRTLLISYRKPTQTFRPAGLISSQHTALPADELELELPAAIRIWKHRNSRFHSILYNSEAVQAHDEVGQAETISGGHENAFFANPIRYDDDALEALTSFFGPLESFGIFDPNKDNQEPLLDVGQYPPPHNALRSACMDSRCWEVKWAHRDDCVSALMTLRRIPHVTATWAHQPSIVPNYQPQPYARNNGSAPYSMHVQQRLPSGYPFMPPQNLYNPQYMQPSQHFQPTVRGQHQRGLSHPYFGRALAERMPHQPWDRDSRQIGPQAQHVGSAPKSCYQGRSGFPSIKLGSQAVETEEPSSPDPEGQELFIPQTPALDSSSITPVTPGSQFPVTPTTGGTSYEGFGLKDDGMLYKPASDREVDPTTLFVGGLEMTGPSAWNEDKVKSFFSRFGGLESVKVVRPANAAAAFAFVKFDNPESPARAVFEEHNRVYDGRAMRVQLRDVNPARGNWKFNRGRGRFPHQQQYVTQRRLNSRPPLDARDRNLSPFNEAGYNDHGMDVNNSITMSSLASALPLEEDTAQPETAPVEASTTAVSDANENADPPRYREWYDDLQSPVATPDPSSLGSSASATGAPYTAPSYQYPPAGSYYPPTPWMPPYMSPAPYPMPYYSGYPTYHPPAHPTQPPSLGSTSSSDTSSPTPVGQPVWPGIGAYGSFIPYPGIPPRPPVTGQPHTPVVGQAPVVPAGFIHNEQGALIAVYQPEALNQYMSVAGPNPTSASTLNRDGSQRPGPHTPSLSRPYEHGTVSATPPHVQLNRGHSANTAVPDHRYPGFQRPPMPFRHADGNLMSPASPSGHRRPHNRPFQQNFNGVRNPNHGYNNSRAFNGRPGRSFLQNVPSPATGRLAYDWPR